MSAEELLPGEDVILKKNANAIVEVLGSGLSRFAFDHLMGAVGLAGHEAIGGRLRLTTYRLRFTAHPVNRLRGSFSIWLPTVREVRDTSSGLKRQVSVTTGAQRSTFVVWGIPALIRAIDTARAALDAEATARLVATVRANPGLVGDGLEIRQGVEAVNQILSVRTHRSGAPARFDRNAVDGLGPVASNAALNLAELLELGDAGEAGKAGEAGEGPDDGSGR